MKLKYFCAALVAVFTAAFTSCSDEYESTTLDQIQVSQSTVAIAENGGTTTIDVIASEDWYVDAIAEETQGTGVMETKITYVLDRVKNDGSYLLDKDGNKIVKTEKQSEKTKKVNINVKPGEEKWPYEWLNVERNGNKLSFSAPDNAGVAKSGVVYIHCGKVTQVIKVVQGKPGVAVAKCAEVNSGIPGKTYNVTGVVTKIANTSYGNFYINDGTGELYIYGLKDDSGNYNWGKFNIEIGDQVTVEGPLVIYNGTYELSDATWVKTVKSLIKVSKASAKNNIAPAQAGEFAITLDSKGDGVGVESIPAEASSWLSISRISGNTVYFNMTENDNYARGTVVTFTTTQTDSKGNVTESSCQLLVGQNGKYGSTPETALTMAQAIDAANNYNTGNVPMYVKGMVSKLITNSKNSENPGFTNSESVGTFYMSEDGAYHNDKALDFEAYKVYYVGGQNWTSVLFPQVKEGDTVILYSPLTNYKGLAETGTDGYIYSIK